MRLCSIGSTGAGMNRSNERIRRCSRSIAWPNMISTSALARCWLPICATALRPSSASRACAPTVRCESSASAPAFGSVARKYADAAATNARDADSTSRCWRRWWSSGRRRSSNGNWPRSSYGRASTLNRPGALNTSTTSSPMPAVDHSPRITCKGRSVDCATMNRGLRSRGRRVDRPTTTRIDRAGCGSRFELDQRLQFLRRLRRDAALLRPRRSSGCRRRPHRDPAIDAAPAPRWSAPR